MYALTLWEPWATLIARGDKTIETRSWRPQKHHIGSRIAIHAGVRVDRESVEELLPEGVGWYSKAIIATAKLDAIGYVFREPVGRDIPVRLDNGTTRWVREDRYGDFRAGRYLWFLSGVRRIDPFVECKGAMGLWKLPYFAEKAVFDVEYQKGERNV